jgi:hypothetical protein
MIQMREEWIIRCACGRFYEGRDHEPSEQEKLDFIDDVNVELSKSDDHPKITSALVKKLA